VPADGDFKQRYLAENQRLGEQGLRVLATARKDLDPVTFDPGADLLPLVNGLEMLALVGIVDPPRPAAKASIATAKAAGIRIRMITGANALILALAIGAAAVVLVTFVFTTLIHEPASVVTLLAVLALSIGLDLWKRVRGSRASGGTTSDVQVGN